MISFEYRSANVRDFQVAQDPIADGPTTKSVTAVAVDGETLLPGNRFWKSLFYRLGLSEQVFRYYTYDEVFARVVESGRNDRLQLCIERPGNGRGKLLAVTSPRRPVLQYAQARQLVDQHAGEDAFYRDGVIVSRHTPRSGFNGFSIGPDKFHNRFMMETPIDGYGQPRIYLSLLRQICANGAIGYARAFRSDLRIGDDAAFTLERAMSQFDHEEGFTALRQRFESAQTSWASVSEVRQLEKVLTRCNSEITGGSLRAITKLHNLSGDLNAVYGLANLESLSQKRQRILPAACRVYDVLNFASELATHHARGEAQVRLNAYIGSLVSDEFDLEGTAENVPEFRDLFISRN
jgi:hypothetical protein